MALPFCGAKTRAGTPCKRPAGWGTDHVGTGRCKLHGGKSTGPKNQRGNKNALKTGEYESIFVDVLDPDERGLYAQMKVEVAAQLDEEIRLITIRERRMMQRIARLKEVEMTVVEESETEEGEEIRPVDEDAGNAVVLVKEKKTTLRKVGTLGQIQHIEEALTRVQAQKARLLELKHKVESGVGPDHPDLRPYFEALEATAEDVWGDAE